ncbi:MAG: N-acyl-D-amino-acid deacylase family protein [Steroidobacteraceae bacterium]
MRIVIAAMFVAAVLSPLADGATGWDHDTIIRNGLIYDGSGTAPYVGDVAIDGDRISYVGNHARGRARTDVDAHGKAITPGFINMLAHSEESLLVDGRALSDLVQGVTLEVFGEFSMGPLTPRMRELFTQRQADIHFAMDWTTLGEYLDRLQRRGISPNVASFVGAGTVRNNVLGEIDVQPTAEQLHAMEALVHQAMEEGALGVTTMLEYVPETFAKTPELIALAKESARCGGMYSAHIRSESDRLIEAIQETIDIARASGAPVEIYHFKQSGVDNWSKYVTAINLIDGARRGGIPITANMYVYNASATGLDAAMPIWVQDGGLEKWITRLKDPSVRARVAAEMRNPHPKDWENVYAGAGGATGVLFLSFKNPALKPLTGKTLAEVAKMRGVSPEDAAMDLVVEDGADVGVAYFDMTDDNVRREVALPWMSFGSDEAAPAPEGVFLQSNSHPRAYGNFARVLAKYVREEHVLRFEAAIRKLTALPAENLSIKERGRLTAGYFADVVILDPATIQDHSTYEKPNQLATGVQDVWVNGVQALKDGVATGVPSGRVVHGRGWIGAPGGGCRASSRDWTWNK